MSLPDSVRRYLQHEGQTIPETRVIPLSGDASDRRYFRVISPDGGSSILALYAGPFEFHTLPFAQVSRLLERMQLPAPAILGHSDELGVVRLQDLGDITLLTHLDTVPPAERMAVYRQAVALIDALQRRGAEARTDHDLPYQLAFDVEKLTWELNFFVTHFIEGVRGAVLSTTDRRALDEEWAAIAGELAAEPRVLCHRDYHSRNLMRHDGRLYLIDFQDARMGPDTYDLASLLRDSYVDITAHEVDDLFAYFLALKRDAVPAAQDRVDAAEFRRRFDLMALQRNVKALGTFGYQAMVRRNPSYLQYVPRTLGYVRANLETYPRFARLREVLAAHIGELR